MHCNIKLNECSPLIKGVTLSFGPIAYVWDLGSSSAASVKEPPWMAAMPQGRGPRW